MTASCTFRFGPCELDEARRALRVHGREAKLQPRVFDLLCYLVRHRDRVVTKDELLDALWPGTVVVDNALQRVVSLARAALAEGGLENAVRTYARHGYRFCVDNCDEALPAAAAALPTHIAAAPATRTAAAHAACEASDWAGACAHFERADREAPLAPGDVEAWGRAAICAGLGASAIAALERTVNARTAAGDAVGAARAMLLLVQIQIDRRQGVIAHGLLQRASRCLDEHPSSVERGHFAWMSSRFALGSGDPAAALRYADEACAVGRALANVDIECLGIAYRGHALLNRGEVEAAVALHAEATALTRLPGITPWVAGWVLCSVLYAARHRCDWLRAAQIAEVYAAWSRNCKMPAFPGTCQLHRAAVLCVCGDLEAAATEARAAVASVASVAPWAEGDAYCVMGDIQLNHGDVEAAEASFRQAHAAGWDPQPGLARLHLMTGRPALAQRGLTRALDDVNWCHRERRAQLLCLLVRAAVAAGDVAGARAAAAQIDADPAMISTEALQAAYADAQADLALADGHADQGAQHLRSAIRHWREVGSPMGEGEARLRLAERLLRAGDMAGAELELHAVEANTALRAAAFVRAQVASLRSALGAAAAINPAAATAP